MYLRAELGCTYDDTTTEIFREIEQPLRYSRPEPLHLLCHDGKEGTRYRTEQDDEHRCDS